MGVLNNILGFNLTNEEPLTHSPFSSSYDEGSGTPPPEEFRMITETGVYMITQTSLQYMITE